MGQGCDGRGSEVWNNGRESKGEKVNNEGQDTARKGKREKVVAEGEDRGGKVSEKVNRLDRST